MTWPLVITRGEAVYPVSRRNDIRKGDEADVLIFSEQADKAIDKGAEEELNNAIAAFKKSFA